MPIRTRISGVPRASRALRTLIAPSSLQCLDDFQRGPHRPLSIVLVGVRIAKVDQEPIAQILRDMPVEPADDRGAGGVIAPHDGSPFLRIQPRRQRRRAHHVTEHHGELAALAFAPGLRALLDLPRAGPLPLAGATRGAPHSAQNLAWDRFSSPHRGQRLSQRRCALDAELGAFRIRRATGRAAHVTSVLLRPETGHRRRRCAPYDLETSDGSAPMSARKQHVRVDSTRFHRKAIG